MRLNIISGKTPPGKFETLDWLAEQLAGDSAKYGVATIPLGDCAVMVRYDMPGAERGLSLKIRCSRIVQALPTNNFRHVLFTYTLLADHFDQPEALAEMELLDREITAPVLTCSDRRYIV